MAPPPPPPALKEIAGPQPCAGWLQSMPLASRFTAHRVMFTSVHFTVGYMVFNRKIVTTVKMPPIIRYSVVVWPAARRREASVVRRIVAPGVAASINIIALCSCR
jgi:hypothetical protein